MKGKNIILDKILDMKEEFNIMKQAYEETLRQGKLEQLIDRIDFMEDRLKILKVALLDEGARQHCLELKDSIDKFKKENSLVDYQHKLNLISGLDQLIQKMDTMKAWEISSVIEGLFAFVHLNKADMVDLNQDRKVYLNKLGDISEYKDWARAMDSQERYTYARELLENLLEFSLDSYNKNPRPLDLYEKIMIINILDAAKFYLKYKEEEA